MSGISIISIHPNFINSYFSFGVCRSAIEKGINLEVIDLRDFAVDSRGTVDSSPYGGDDGMVLRPEPLADAISSIKSRGLKPYVIYTAAFGKLWFRPECLRFSNYLVQDKFFGTDLNEYNHLVFICGRFSGIDQRFIDKYVNEIFSIGDFILSGGELPVLTMVDSFLRYCPSVLGNSLSSVNDSLEDSLEGGIEYPLYSRPQEFEGESVPDVLVSGDHKKIEEWKKKMSRLITQKYRPDLLIKKESKK